MTSIREQIQTCLNQVEENIYVLKSIDQFYLDELLAEVDMFPGTKGTEDHISRFSKSLRKVTGELEQLLERTRVLERLAASREGFVCAHLRGGSLRLG
jgi:hypothetical protein